MEEIIIADTDTAYTAAKELFEEYATWLGIDLCFQKFDEELLQLREMYGLPTGAILLYKTEEGFGGCVAIRDKGNNIAELKRMYIKPEYRGRGVGKILLEKALALSKELGYKKIRLDTLSSMTTAIQLYRSAGFYNIEAYYFNPEPAAVFFEKEL
jgi:ribosomal protein S18 acetylase RimI-like enzyme